MFATTRDFLSTMERHNVRYEIMLEKDGMDCIHTHAIGEKSREVFDLLVFFYAERISIEGQICSVTDEKLPSMLVELNELNHKASFATFFLYNNDGKIYVRARENYFLGNRYLSTRNGSRIDIDWGALCTALCLSFSEEIDKAYPRIMRAMWSD